MLSLECYLRMWQKKLKVYLSFAQTTVIASLSDLSIVSEMFFYKSCLVWYAIWGCGTKSESLAVVGQVIFMSNLGWWYVRLRNRMSGYKPILNRYWNWTFWLNRMLTGSLECWKYRKMLTVNMRHVLVFYEHATLFPLELLFQWSHKNCHFKGFLISFVHASFIEHKVVFWSNMQVFGSTCGSYGSNQY